MSKLEWHALTARELRGLAARDAVVIVPVGSTEQHGPHLPVQVDALLATEVSRRAAARLVEREPVVVAPTVWCGLAEHHMAFGGTLTLDFATYHALLRCVCASIVRHGFRRLLLLNGHGGNITALNVIVGELARELEAPVATATYWLIPEAAEAFGHILDAQRNVQHACEAETSMLLCLHPELVDQTELAGIEAPAEVRLSADGVYRWRSFSEVTGSGAIGVPGAASADKGARLLDAAAIALANAIASGRVWPD